MGVRWGGGLRGNDALLGKSTAKIAVTSLLKRGLLYITKTYLYNFDPLKPHVYIVKLGFTVVYIIFSYFCPKHSCGYSLEPPRRGGSNEYPQSMF